MCILIFAWVKNLAVRFIDCQNVSDHFSFAEFEDEILVFLGIEVYVGKLGPIKPIVSARLHDGPIGKAYVLVKTLLIQK